MSDLFGTTNFDQGGFTSAKHHKILTNKDGSPATSIFRIVPPILERRATGQIVVYEPKHWGFFGKGFKDPTKASPRTFICPRQINFRTRDVEVACAECDLIDELSKEREALVLTKNVKKNDRAAALAKLPAGDQSRVRLLDEFLDGREQGAGAHKIDNKRWKVNVVWYDGVAGDLGLTSAQWNAIKARKGEEVTKPGLIDSSLRRKDRWDPIAPDQGRWFKCVRTGYGFETKDLWSFQGEMQALPSGEEVEVPVKAPITDAMEQAIQSGCRDLSDCSPSHRVTADQVAQLVRAYNDGTNTPDVVDEILGVVTQPARNTMVSPAQNYRGDEGDDEVPEFVAPVAQTKVQVQVTEKIEPAKVQTVPVVAQTEARKLDKVEPKKAAPAAGISDKAMAEMQAFIAAHPELAAKLAKKA